MRAIVCLGLSLHPARAGGGRDGFLKRTGGTADRVVTGIHARNKKKDNNTCTNAKKIKMRQCGMLRWEIGQRLGKKVGGKLEL